ncbi:MAG TPA: hypothetical protein VIV61_00655 [Candidatus Ozemobacteraceae bacterium]
MANRTDWWGVLLTLAHHACGTESATNVGKSPASAPAAPVVLYARPVPLFHPLF